MFWGPESKGTFMPCGGGEGTWCSMLVQDFLAVVTRMLKISEPLSKPICFLGTYLWEEYVAVCQTVFRRISPQ